MEHVRRTRKPVLITKRRRVGPPAPGSDQARLRLRGSVVSARDVVSPAVRVRDIRALR